MLKRSFDIIFSFSGLVLLLPVFVLISLLVMLGSRGGIFFMQERVGRDNKNFNLFKFRTMSAGAEKRGLLTIGGRDPRITKVGYYLRKYKLDELPQLINVLAGSMSVVGPRPEVRRYVALYNPEQLRVLTVRPGITDYASLAYFDENDLLARSADPEGTYINEIMPAKLALNKKYLAEKTFGGDLKIIVQTLKRIVA